MESDRKIGKIVSVNSYSATIELDKDAQSFVKNSYAGTHKIGIINSYIIIPIGSDKIVGIVTKVNMFEDAELNYKNSSAIVLPKSKRTMTITMIGSIVTRYKESVKEKETRFEYGVVGYPSLDNPVWSITEDELEIIFSFKTSADKKNIKIGKSTVFPDYDIVLDMDKFFGKHAAVLGNTGSGKSCTVTAIIRSVLEDKPEMKNAHFIIFDTNNEYENAFTEYEDEKRQKIKKIFFDRLVIRDDGLQIPHWFMNGEDYEALFTPGGQIQAPVLAQSIIRARNSSLVGPHSFGLLINILRQSIIVIKELMIKTTGPVTYDIRSQCLPFHDPVSRTRLLIGLVHQEIQSFNPDTFIQIFENILQVVPNPGTNNQGNPNWVIPSSDIRLAITQYLVELESLIQLELQRNIRLEQNLLTTIDTPKKFSFDEFISRFLEEEIQEQERNTPRVRADMSTLLLRINRMFRDPRYNFFFKLKPFNNALATFLRFIFGESPDKNFENNEVPWKEYYIKQTATASDRPHNIHSVTIIDFSNVSSDVLENMTALVGRLIFEFMQRIEERGSFPVVLVLEEAHHYIPEEARTPRQERARNIFERISKEGRKFGLSMLIASQRPSELSKTVMAQCNSFIVHRIQNPEDQKYFRSVISSVSHDLLNQLPSLPQRSALVMGDCVTAPVQVTIRDVNPTPDSRDPKFSEIWSKDDFKAPDFEDICKKWEDGE